MACPHRQKNEEVGLKRATTSRVRGREAVMEGDQSRGLNRWERRAQEEEEARRRKGKTRREKRR